MRGTPPRLRGVLAPAVTPFDAALRPDPAAFVAHCSRLADRGVGLAVFGTNSEANSLSAAERTSLLGSLLDAGVPPGRMLVGTGSCALPESIALSRHAVGSGCAGVLVLPPFYYKGVSDAGLFDYFCRLVEGVGDARLRLYLYHIPAVAQVGFSLGLIERLLGAYPGVVAGIKDSAGDWAHTHALIGAFQSEAFDVFCGNETFLLQTLQHGGAGCITATANVSPAAILALYRDWQAGDAAHQQQRLNALRQIFARFPLIAAMKAAIAWKTGVAGWAVVRPPLVALSGPQREQLEQDLDAAGWDATLFTGAPTACR